MAVEIETSTDTVEEVAAAMGAKTPKEEKPAAKEKPAQKIAKEEPVVVAEDEDEPEPQDEEAEPVGDGDEEEPKPVPKTANNTIPRARLNKAIQERNTLRDRAAHLEEENRRLRGSQQDKPNEPAATPQTFSGKVKPTLEQFQSNPDKFPDPWSAYAEAISDWKVDEAMAKRDMEAAETKALDEKKALFTDFKVRRDTAAEERYVDYAEVVSDSEVHVSELMERFILKDKWGPDICYFFAENPDRAANIESLSTADQAVAMSELRDEIREQFKEFDRPAKGKEGPLTAAPKATKSKAPLPPNPVRGGNQPPRTLRQLAGSEDKAGVDVTFSRDYERVRKEQSLRARQR